MLNSKLKLKKFIVPFVLIFLGLLMFCYGFLVDPLWPAQDMPIEVELIYNSQRQRADWIYTLATFPLGVGVVWIIGMFLYDRVRNHLKN